MYFNNIFYLTQHVQNIISTFNCYKIINEIYTFCFPYQVFKIYYVFLFKYNSFGLIILQLLNSSLLPYYTAHLEIISSQFTPPVL